MLPAGTRWRRWNRKGWSAFASLNRSVSIGVLAVGMSILLLATPSALAQTSDTTAVLKTLRIREVGVTDLVDFLPLKETAREWAKKALASAGRERRSYLEEIRESGFDAEEQAARMARLYETGTWE